MQVGLLVLACFLTCEVCTKMYIAKGKDKRYLLKMGKETGTKKHHGGHNNAGGKKRHHKSRKSSKKTTIAQTTIMEVGALEAGNDYSDSSEQVTDPMEASTKPTKPTKPTKTSNDYSGDACPYSTGAEEVDVLQAGHALAPGHVPAPGGCQIHYQCKSAEVCTKEGSCQYIKCGSNEECQAKVNLPTLCQGPLPKMPKSCSMEAYCKDNAECQRAGPSFVCHRDSGQCKPSFGNCETSCDCVQKYGMKHGEAICQSTGTQAEHERVCICRSNHLAECGRTAPNWTPQPGDAITPKPEVYEDQVLQAGKYEHEEPPSTEGQDFEHVTYKHRSEVTTWTPIPQTTPPLVPGVAETTPPPPPQVYEAEESLFQAGHWEPRTTCPAPPPDKPGLEGAPCTAHTACFMDAPMKLICAKKGPEVVGSCRKVPCKADPDCQSVTDLPARCSGGSCAFKECYEDSACPRGYACYEGQCKKDLGSCEYDCDCSMCDPTQCFNGHCFCKADHDQCTVSPDQEGDHNPMKPGAKYEAEGEEPLPKYEGEMTELPPKYEGEMTEPPPKYEGEMTEPPPKYEGEMTEPPPKYEGEITETPPKYEGEMTELPPKYEGEMTEPSSKYEGEPEVKEEGKYKPNAEDEALLEQLGSDPEVEQSMPEAEVVMPEADVTKPEGEVDKPEAEVGKPEEEEDNSSPKSDQGVLQKGEAWKNGGKLCSTCSCPKGWEHTKSGCYKLFKMKNKKKLEVSRETALEMCKTEGGFIAEVSTKMEMANLQSVFKYKIIPVWLGATREAGGEFQWASGERFVAEKIDGEEEEGANCLIRKAQRMVAKSCDSKQLVLCEIASNKPKGL